MYANLEQVLLKDVHSETYEKELITVADFYGNDAKLEIQLQTLVSNIEKL